MYCNFQKEVMRGNNQTRNRICAPSIKYLISPSGSSLTTQPKAVQSDSQTLERLVYTTISQTICCIKGLIIFLTQQPTYLEKLQLPGSDGGEHVDI